MNFQMCAFRKFFVLLVFTVFCANIFAFQCLENPKSTHNELNISYNSHYDVIEVNPKIINNLFTVKKDKYHYNVFYGLNLFVQAPNDLRGHYAVHDMFGIIGINFTYAISEKWQVNFLPLYHESSHYLDGLLKSPSRPDSLKNTFTDEELDGISQECVILNFGYKASEKIAYYFGGGYYYHTTGRELNYFLRTATDYNFYKKFWLSGDLSYIDEDYGNSLGISSSVTYKIGNGRVGLFYSNKKGLGRDYKHYQEKVGLKVIYAP